MRGDNADNDLDIEVGPLLMAFNMDRDASETDCSNSDMKRIVEQLHLQTISRTSERSLAMLFCVCS